MKLRDYQVLGEQKIKDAIISGHKKILYFMATGGGKSANFGSIAHNAVRKGKKVLIVMRRRGLIFQAQKIMKRWGHEPSIIMGSERGFFPILPIQICSIDTIHRRIEKPEYYFLQTFDLILVDEAHDCTSPSYMKFFNFFSEKSFFVGFTATPFPIGNQVHDFWDTCVKPIEMHELIERGYLVAPKIYAPKVIDVSDIKIMNGDFKLDDLFKRVSEMKVIGDIVDTYKERGKNKPAILFAVNKAHSALMAAAFNDAGIPALHRDESHTQKERQFAIDSLINGKIKILCNVNIFSTGTDVPIAEIGIMARPTMSEVLYIQQVGRLLRPYNKCKNCFTEYGGEKACPRCKSKNTYYTKPFATILDHANNVTRHGMPEDVREAILSKDQLEKKKKREKGEVRVKMCPECFLNVKNDTNVCPECGYVFKTEREVKKEDGELELVTKEKQLEIKIIKRARQLKAQSGAYRWKNGTVEKKLYKEFGVALIKLADKLNLNLRYINEERLSGLLQTTPELIEKYCTRSTQKFSKY